MALIIIWISLEQYFFLNSDSLLDPLVELLMSHIGRQKKTLVYYQHTHSDTQICHPIHGVIPRRGHYPSNLFFVLCSDKTVASGF